MAAPAVSEAIEHEQSALTGRGRVLVRASGTEPLIRVMVEAPTTEETDDVCARLTDGRSGRARRLASGVRRRDPHGQVRDAGRRARTGAETDPLTSQGPAETTGGAAGTARAPVFTAQPGGHAMCGIVGYVGPRKARPLLLRGA